MPVPDNKELIRIIRHADDDTEFCLIRKQEGNIPGGGFPCVNYWSTVPHPAKPYDLILLAHGMLLALENPPTGGNG